MRLHSINRWRIQQRNTIRIVMIIAFIITVSALTMYGAYEGGAYIGRLHTEVITLRSDNQQAMAMMSGAVYQVDGQEQRLVEVEVKPLVRGL